MMMLVQLMMYSYIYTARMASVPSDLEVVILDPDGVVSGVSDLVFRSTATHQLCPVSGES